VTVELVSEPVPFPSVTLCNMRSLDFTVLNRINQLFVEDHTALSYVNRSLGDHFIALGDPFVEAYMTLVARFSALYYYAKNANSTSSVIHEMVRALQEGITRSTLYSYIPEEVLSKAGIRLEQYVAICIFGGSDCNITRDFQRLFHPYYYNCYTYNDPLSSTAASNLHSSSQNKMPWPAYPRTSDRFSNGS